MSPRELLRLEKTSLAHLPTPLEHLPRLSEALGGPTIYIKRDDQTGLAFGGNKTRKLEYLMADALQKGADTVITAGAAQSNHCRQTAAAAARVGLACTLVLGGQPPEVPAGNLLLDRLLGAEIVWTGPQRRGERLEEVTAQLQSAGRNPYVIPYGGSNPLGAAGYVFAMGELVGQLKTIGLVPDRVVFASSSGGTQAGLMVGARAFDFYGQVLGVRIDKDESEGGTYQEQVASLANNTAMFLGADMDFKVEDVHLTEDYLGAGYGVVGFLEREAIRLAAVYEGLLLDPVYTGRAFGGLIDLIRQGIIRPDEKIVFWHTGGNTALFPYAADVLA